MDPIIVPALPQVEAQNMAELCESLLALSTLIIATCGIASHFLYVRKAWMEQNPTRVFENIEYSPISDTPSREYTAISESTVFEEDDGEGESLGGIQSMWQENSIFSNHASTTHIVARWSPVFCTSVIIATLIYKLRSRPSQNALLFDSNALWFYSEVLVLLGAISSANIVDLAGPTSNVTMITVSTLHMLRTLLVNTSDASTEVGHDTAIYLCLGTNILLGIIRSLYDDKAKLAVLQANNLASYVSLEKHSHILGYLMFCWLTPLVKLASTKILTPADVWKLRNSDMTASVLKYYKDHSRSEAESFGVNSGDRTSVTQLGDRKCGIYHSLGRSIAGYAALQFIISTLTVFLQFSGPFFINLLLKCLESLSETSSPDILFEPVLIIVSLVVCNLALSCLNGQLYFIGRRLSSHARSILIAEIYAKSLRKVSWSGQSHKLMHSAEDPEVEEDQNASTGKIVSLLSVDVEKIREYLSYTHTLLNYFPLSLAVSVISLSYVMGLIPTMCGVSVLVVMGPINYWTGARLKRSQEVLSNATDKRVNATNELLHGIRILKYLAWEGKFQDKINVLRDKELAELFTVSMNQLLFSSSSISSGLCVSFVIFSVHTLMAPDYKMDPATAFTGLYLVQQFMEILSRLPWDAMLFFQAKVSMQRVAKFLDEPEIEQNFSESTNQHKTCIGFSKASFAFFGCSTLQGKSGTICLENIDLDFRVNGLNVVCGSTGSGKTSLCLALLGELDRVSGCTHLRDGKSAQPKVAYAAQCAWLLNATLRENVVMGAVFDEDRYHQTLEAAALIKDLDNFQAGDLTLIGEKGVNVSGGQKQRISIARALYSDANIVILDDPLSAVDAPTARHLLAYAICGPLLRNRTVILVTHAISLVLPVADFVVVMNGGKVLASGTASDLAKDLDVNDIHETMLEDAPASMSTGSVLKSSPRSLTSLTLRDSQALLHNEKVASGNVSLRVYTDYVKAAGGIKFALLFLGSFVLSIFVQFGNDYWLKRWSEAGQATRATSVGELYFDTFLVATPLAWNSPFTKTSLTESKRSQIQTSTAPPTTVIYYISIYGLFGLAVIISQNLNVLVTALSSKKASQKLHDRLLQALLGAPLRFFEVTPIGRILNRLSKDVSIIDQNVMSTVRWFLRCVFSAIMVIAVIASGSLAFLGAMIPIGWLAMKIGNMYLSASRELKRLESVSRSPIYNQFSESLNGVVTIRAYRQTDRFLHQNNNKVDNNHRFFYTLWACNRWLTLRTDFISATVVFCSGVTVLLARSYITKGWAGIILLYAGKFSDALVWVVRMHADMEMSLDSVERCVEYCEIEQEPPRVNEHYRPRQSWPEHGVIHVKNLSVRYALDQPRVLKDLNFTVKPGEKIGVVGRTGAGKSTLSLAFFRIVPFDEGTIEIDGMDIQKMGLHDLRSRLTIIPQDAVLFEGTIRSNLDPFDEYTDAEIWQVLRETHVLESLQQKAACTSTNLACHETLVEVESPESIAPFNLDHPVTENGNNFSQGQRQLFCMARALLRNARVVILDEATASIDGPTDARIQTTIRERLWDKTIFCIAHRLRSVADYDRILVLNYGEIVEYASPFELLMGEAMNVLDESKALISGQFASMCRESGEFETILEIARAAWDRKLD